MVRTRPSARSLISHEEYLKRAMISPMNNCPGGIGPKLRKQYEMEQRAKKKEAALREKLAKMALADANRPPLSEKAQRRKEKRKLARNKKKMGKENMDIETQDEKVDTESKTPNEQEQSFIGPECCPPVLSDHFKRAAVLTKELEAGNDTLEVVTELVVVENIIEKISLHYKASGLFASDWTYDRATPSDYSVLKSMFRMSF